MGDTTDDLVRLAYEISPRPEPRELDMLISVGERISCALAAMAIQRPRRRGDLAHRQPGGDRHDTAHGKAKNRRRARPPDPRGARRRQGRPRCGLPGRLHEPGHHTLGRGGSDTTAVALAAALSASHCEIYTDVAGVFSANPRVVPNARKLHAVSYDEMLELAASGAKVLQLRSVEVARTTASSCTFARHSATTTAPGHRGRRADA